jgi:hypothetical protein
MVGRTPSGGPHRRWRSPAPGLHGPGPPAQPLGTGRAHRGQHLRPRTRRAYSFVAATPQVTARPDFAVFAPCLRLCISLAVAHSVFVGARALAFVDINNNVLAAQNSHLAGVRLLPEALMRL